MERESAVGGAPVALLPVGQVDALSRREARVPGSPRLPVAQLVPVLDEVSRYDGLFACVGVPPPIEPNATRSEVLAAVARVPDGRARMVPDTAWTLRVQTEACPAPAELDGGRDDRREPCVLGAVGNPAHD